MTGTALILGGLAVLALVWGGPLPGLVPGSFAAHMTLHMIVVGIGAPLVAIGVAARLRGGLIEILPPVVPAILTVLDLVVVWGWHAPALHHAARSTPLVLGVEQASFAAVTLGLWLTAFAGPAFAGALALFATSMHMTLLGALLGLATRPVFPGHHDHDAAFGGLSALEDQHLGGAIMLGVGGLVYLVAALGLASRVLRQVDLR